MYCYTVALDENDVEICKYRNDVRGNFLYESMYDCVATTSQ